MRLRRIFVAGILSCTTLAGCNNSDSKSSNAAISSAFDGLKGDVGNLTKTSEDLNAQLAKAQNALNEIKIELAALAPRLSDKAGQAELERLRTQLEVVQNGPSNITAESIAALIAEIDGLKTRIATLNAALKEKEAPAKSHIVHVSVSGSDSNPGSAELPMETVGKALEAVKKLSAGDASGWQVVVREGTYYLDSPLKIGAILSGKPGAPFVLKAAEGSKPVFSGARKLDLVWTETANSNVWTAKFPGAPFETAPFDELYVKGQRQVVARYPNSGYPDKDYPELGWGTENDIKKRYAKWADPTGGFRQSMHSGHWGGYHEVILRKQGADVIYSAKTGNNGEYGGGVSKDKQFVENIFEELDATNEWFLNTRTGILSYIPDDMTDPNNALVEGSALKSLVNLSGSQTAPVHDINIKGFVFTQTGNTFMQTAEPLLRSDWKIYRGGAIYITGGENIDIGGNSLHHIGSNGIFVDGYNRHIRIHDNDIHDIGASGIAFVGSAQAVWNPLFEYNSKPVPVNEISQIPGPKTKDYPAESIAENNLIRRVGIKEIQATGVEISIASKVTVSHNSIYDMPRAGINIGDGTWGGHIIEHNDVFRTVQVTGDHGSFNSWGRDRFWDPDFKSGSPKPGKNYAELVKLDAIDTTIIRNNRFRCDRGWDIDLDDGSSNYLIENNILLGGLGLKNREGYNRTTRNNIVIGGEGRFFPQIWPENSGDSVTFNIFKSFHETANMHKPTKPGLFDYNFYTNKKALTEAQSHSKFPGDDKHSISGSPEFVDPANGDYTLKDSSPALKLGFKNIPNDFGVQNEPLKSKAEKPQWADLSNVDPDPDDTISFAGYTMKSIAAGSPDSSAYAIPFGIAAVGIVEAPADSALQKQDAIVSYVNGNATVALITAGEVKALFSGAEKTIIVNVYRGSKLIQVTVTLP